MSKTSTSMTAIASLSFLLHALSTCPQFTGCQAFSSIVPLVSKHHHGYHQSQSQFQKLDSLQFKFQRKNLSCQFALSPSRVTDDDGPTPDPTPFEPETIPAQDIPEFHYDPKAVPIPHQPWRRGDTDGCEDPIDAPWRLEAEQIIRMAVTGVGAEVRDVTWYMGTVLVTLEESRGWKVMGPEGPEIRVEDISQPIWFDENDPEPEDDYGIYAGEEDGRLEIQDEDGNISSGIPNDPYDVREFDETTGMFLPRPTRPTREGTVRNMSYEEFEKFESNGMKVQMIDRDERITKQKLSMEEFQAKLEEYAAESGMSVDELEVRAEELRARYLKSEDLAAYYPEEFEKVGKEEAVEKLAMPTVERADGIDTQALSIITRAITDALSDPDVEDRLEILSRHDVVLASPGDEERYVETQRQFDQMRGEMVAVQTQDPFGSNRVLRGRLVDRNALDVIINVKGRMVTIPLSMVAYVAIPAADGSYVKPEYIQS
jgi:ribosome maturation factor RimP